MFRYDSEEAKHIGSLLEQFKHVYLLITSGLGCVGLCKVPLGKMHCTMVAPRYTIHWN